MTPRVVIASLFQNIVKVINLTSVVLIKMAAKLDKFCAMAFVKSSLTLPTGQIHVCEILVEHSHEIFPVYSEKVPYENPENIPK